jgi:thiosulfate dehydrogenase [quinone] large subunit
MVAIRHPIDSKGVLRIQDPPIAQVLFQSTRASVIWLVLRLWMAYGWLEAGWHKFNDPAWMVDGTGILGFWTRALGNAPNGKPVITYDWCRTVIQVLVDINTSVRFARVIAIANRRSASASWLGRSLVSRPSSAR